MKIIKILMFMFLLSVLASCQQSGNELLDESQNPEADEVALKFTESYVNRDLENIIEMVDSEEELESYAQFRVDRQGDTGTQIYNGMNFNEALNKMLEENVVADDYNEEDLEIISQYSEGKSSYVATHAVRESREPDYYQIDEKGIFNSTFRNMYGADESFIIFTFEVNNEGKVINLNSDYKGFVEEMANKNNTYILRGEVDLKGGE